MCGILSPAPSQMHSVPQALSNQALENPGGGWLSFFPFLTVVMTLTMFNAHSAIECYLESDWS